MRLKITLAYDGRAFEGSQSQASGNTVQDFLLIALEQVAKKTVKIYLAGRTDSGVHALGQTAHFDAPPEITMNTYNWVPALNRHLPPALRVMSCEEVAENFNARFDATGKVYEYKICTLPILPPLQVGLAWHIPKLFDADALREALLLCEGSHDFRYFAAVRGNEKEDMNYIRTIKKTELIPQDDGFIIRYEGDGFFYKMVRLLTGTCVHVAQGKMPLSQLHEWLHPVNIPHNTTSHHCAPPDGLTLIAVKYE